jgi:hypothetical protein
LAHPHFVTPLRGAAVAVNVFSAKSSEKASDEAGYETNQPQCAKHL